jgi:hypothetical protein
MPFFPAKAGTQAFLSTAVPGGRKKDPTTKLTKLTKILVCFVSFVVP